MEGPLASRRLALLVLSVVAVGLDSVILNGNFDSHGTFTSVFLTHLSGESRDTANNENEFRKQRRKSEVMKDSGQSAIDVNWKWLDQLARDRLHCSNESRATDCTAVMNSMPSPGSPL